jgi:hypothetical protein
LRGHGKNFEPGKDLIHVKEEQIKNKNLYWEIEFAETEECIHKTNLDIPLVSKIENGTWNRSKNYITIIHPENFRNNVEFQFAVEKETLKLLKKDTLGRIEFFGFFRKAGKTG